MQRMHHYELVKLGCTMFLHAKEDTKEWTKLLTECLADMLCSVVMFLLMSKINDGISFKDGKKVKGMTTINMKKSENMGVHVEIIKA